MMLSLGHSHLRGLCRCNPAAVDGRRAGLEGTEGEWEGDVEGPRLAPMTPFFLRPGPRGVGV